MNMRVALYTRVSTEDQAREGFSLEVQRTFLVQYAQNLGWTIVCTLPGKDIYMDDGFSGGNMDRPALQRLLFDARNKQFDLVMVYKQDRLSRRLKDLLGLLEELDNLGVGYKSATEPFDTTSSAGKMAIQMLGSCAEFERNRLVERVFPGMLVGVKKGHWQGARYAPYGYRYNKDIKKLEVYEEEAKIVREIFERYINGQSTSQIAGHFYRLGTSSRQGGRFYTKFIGTILKSKVYLGMLVWNRHRYDPRAKTKDGQGNGYKYIANDTSKIVEVPNVHEPIISQKQFDEAAVLLKRNRKNAVVKFKNNNYHLSGVLKCKECGGNFRGIMSITNHRTKVKRPWYRCSSKGVSYLTCHNPSVSADVISVQVWDIIDVVCQNLHVLEELGDMVKLNASQPEQVFLDELEVLTKALNKNLEKQKGLFEVFTQDSINLEIYKDRAELLRNEEKKLRQDIKGVQLRILDKRNAINLNRATEDFLLHLRKFQDNEQADSPSPNHEIADDGFGGTSFLIKTFMRIVFKAVYIQDQRIVNVELNEPWQTSYDEGLKWKNSNKRPQTTATQSEIQNKNRNLPQLESACFWRPMDAK